MKKTVWIALGILLILGAALVLPNLYGVDEGGTQAFSPARYILLEGEINVAMRNPGAAGTIQKAMFRLDTVTGRVWVLQMTVMGNNNPQVQSASWYPVPPGVMPSMLQQ